MGRVPLNTHRAARNQLAKMMRDFKAAAIEDRDVPGFRALVHAFSVLLSYFSFEKDIEVETRIEAIEKRLDEL